MLYKLSISISLILLLCSCNKELFPFENKAVFNDMWESIDRYSGTLESRNVNWDSLKTIYDPLVLNELAKDEFFALMSDLLINFRDPHVWLISPEQSFYSIENLGYSRNINFPVIENNYIQNMTKHSDKIISGDIEGEIGYLYLADFKGDRDENKIIYDRIIDGFKDKKGLIIDMRENDGGTVFNASNLLSRLSSDRILWHRTQNRLADGFDEPFEWHIEPRGDFQFTKKVVVLNGKYTVSAGERFAIGATLLPHISILGDTTANTQGSVMGREMLNGWKYTFTFEKCLAPDGTNYEGTGIPPDIYIESQSSDFSTSDPILERAILEFN